jgi:hypothetical protein
MKHKTRVLIFFTNLSETFLIVRRIQRDIIINVHKYSCKVLIIIVRFETNFKKILKYQVS